MKQCYGILCKNKHGGYYPRYITTLSSDNYSLENIRQNAYPSAIRLFVSENRNKAKKVLTPFLGKDDLPQQELF